MSWKERLPAPAPFLAAWYLALSLLGEAGFTSTRTSDVVGTLIFATVTALAAWVACSRIDRVRATVVSVIVVVWFGLFGTARLLLAPSLSPPWSSPAGMLLVWGIFGAAAVILTMRMKPSSIGIVRGLTTALVLLVIFSLAPLARRSVAGPLPPKPLVVEHRTADRPDIYIVVLDMFSSPRAMKANYGVDLGWFVDSLKSLGFVVPEHARTNYIHTGLVLSTLLNWRLIHPELGTPDQNPWEQTPHLVEDAAAWALLQSYGYRLAFFPTGYKATATNSHADIVMRSPEPLLQGFGQTWVFNTPLDLWPVKSCAGGPCTGNSNFPMPVEGPKGLRWKLRTMAAMADSSGPIVTFVHFLGSHEPFVFNRDCSPREAWWPRAENGPDSLQIHQAYAAQIDCVSHLVIDAVTRIIKASKVPPVIVLQADHGNGAIRIGTMQAQTVGVDAATPTQLQERLEVFAAYRFPGASRVVYDTITPVNVLPLVFNSTLGTTLPTSPDRSWWSTWQQPLAVTEMHWLGAAAPPTALGKTRVRASSATTSAARPVSDND